MSLLNIQDPNPAPFSLFVLGFRPFFLAAGVFAIVSMASWLAVYALGMPLTLQGLSLYHWHAHEMIFGFALAVVAGFLLTAIKNWTGVQTLQYRPLAMLVLLWLGARISLLMGTEWIGFAAVFDLSFNLWLLVATAQPILRVKQWKQMGILSKVLLLGVCNGLFYLGVYGIVELGTLWGTYGGFFILIALVLTMGRRVMPFFIERGVGYPVQLKNSRLLDISSLVFFLLLAIVETFQLDPTWSSVSGLILFVVSLWRLYNWYTPGIWGAPLLWGLYLAFASFTLGFLLFGLIPYFDPINRSLAFHALALGGLGLITISMMSRVTLGHTGRNINAPSKWITLSQWLLLIATLVRVIAPLVLPGTYMLEIVVSQLLWILAFVLFVAVNYPLLTQPRVDGASG